MATQRVAPKRNSIKALSNHDLNNHPIKKTTTPIIAFGKKVTTSRTQLKPPVPSAYPMPSSKAAIKAPRTRNGPIGTISMNSKSKSRHNKENNDETMMSSFMLKTQDSTDKPYKTVDTSQDLSFTLGKKSTAGNSKQWNIKKL